MVEAGPELKKYGPTGAYSDLGQSANQSKCLYLPRKEIVKMIL